ncbi:MAG: zinc-dependent alcohol dehydrogenase [Planctomycetota bacterium]
MATRMTLADLDLLPDDSPETGQTVAVLDAPRRIRCARARIPEPGPGQIRLRVTWVGICGSDLEAYRGSRQPEFLSFPARLGHEVAGRIDRLGPGVTGLREGQQVACRYVWGAFAEYIVCTPFNVIPVPEDVPHQACSQIEVLPGILHAADLARITPQSRVLIMGQGVSGLIMTQVVARHSPAVLAVSDLHEHKLELARRYGATHTYRLPAADARTRAQTDADHPDGFDVVIPCLLDGDGMVDAIDACSLGARLIMYGCIGMCRKPLDFFVVHRKRLEILSTEPRRDIDMRRYFAESLRMVCDGTVDTLGTITDHFPLGRIDEAFALRDADRSGHIHVLVQCSTEETA